MKLPAFQFYPGDWHKDQGVQALDLLQRGAWFEMLLMMHDSEERGVLLLNGNPMPEPVIARRLGLDNQTFNQILTTLLTYGVTSRREADGALICRRMVKDEKLRQIRTEAGKKGGNPSLLNQTSNQNPTTGDKQIPTPSSSSSITEEQLFAGPAAPAAAGSESAEEVPSAKSKPKADKVAAAHPELSFATFWEQYHNGKGIEKRGSKATCEGRWQALPETTRRHILAGLDAYRADCTRNGPEFMPYCEKFLSPKKQLWATESYGKAAARHIPGEQPRQPQASKEDLWGFNDTPRPQQAFTSSQYTGNIH